MTSETSYKDGFGLALVGCGQIATHHLEAMASALPRKIQLCALCDPSKERRAAIDDLVLNKYSNSLLCSGQPARHFDTLEGLLSSSDGFAKDVIDVIFIAVPHDLHETIALQALSFEHAKIVVLEKPLAPTRDACDRLVKHSEKLMTDGQTNTPSPMLIIAEQSPYWHEVALARQLIAEGTIGSIVTAASYYYESMRDNVTSGSVDESGGLGWRGSIARAGGGIALDGGLHWIRPLREMLDRRIERVVAVVRRNLEPRLQMEGESVAHALFQMESHSTHVEPDGAGPLVATYSCNMLATAPMAHDTCPYFRITGTKGELVIHGNGLFREDPGAGGLRLYNEEHSQGKELFLDDRKGGFFLGFAGLWSEIYRIGTNQDHTAAHQSVVRAADDVRVVLAMYKSAANGSWEDV
ncbi:oxidoreductase [Seminavis robusta]|uniref:Oxidoreductase n=1 Tax=Seminavis robusta TaxID=568900 RepID=A0A9N8H1X1_9STRA|nr:oxidoreductase [Seminavis robusta]|eukprot:Sro1_g000390.1 oxidoreductase (410) ;mRNA; f:110171-111400